MGKALVHVMATRCDTCIFRPGNLMALNDGRVDGMVQEADAKNGYIPCHTTFDWGEEQEDDDEYPMYSVVDGPQAMCRGYFDRRSSMLVRLALATDSVLFVSEAPDGQDS